MKWNIVLDSSCDLYNDYLKDSQIGFQVVPLKIVIGNEEFTDDDNIDADLILKKMKAEKTASKTACPSPDSFSEAFKKGDNTFCFTISGQLSGTYNSALIGRDMVLEENPNKKVCVVNSKATAGSLVLLANKTCELINKYDDFDKICSEITAYNDSLRLTFALSNYDSLIKAGRMNSFLGAVATTLGIRAVAIKSKEGTIEVVKKVRGEEKAIEEMVKIISQKEDMKYNPIVINHCQNAKAAKHLKELIQKQIKTDNITILECKALTTFYALNGGIIVSY